MRLRFLLAVSFFISLNGLKAQNTFPSSGNAGIGTTGPVTPLDVVGNVTLENNQNVPNAGATLHFTSLGTTYPGPTIKASLQQAGAHNYNNLVLSSYWDGYKNELTLSNGNVGVGTTNVAAKFNVYQSIPLGSSPQNASLLSTVSGLTGTGTNNFQNNIWLVRNAAGSDWYTTRLHDGISIDLSFQNPQVNTQTWWERDPANNIQSWGNANSTYLTIKSGNVLIGKTTQTNTGYILDVNGNVRANSVVINTTGADFVFSPSYRLNSLANVKKYIDKNHHLPEIASAKKMQTNGLNVGENQTKLLQKVEELTLYLIEQNKLIAEQTKRIGKQNKRIEKLESQLKINRL